MSNPVASHIQRVLNGIKRNRMLNAARDYIKHGWKLLPLIGKDPIKDTNGHIQIGVKSATSNLDRIQQWLNQWPSMNIGGTPPAGITVIDLDIYKNPAVLRPIANELYHLGGPVQRSGGGGAHIIVHGPVPRQSELCRSFGLETGIDVKESGKGYIVLAPSVHPDTRRLYEWLSTLQHQTILLPEQLINGHEVSIPTQGMVIPTLWDGSERKKTIAALKAIDPDIDYGDWIRIGQALHSANEDMAGEPFDLWNQWSATGAKYKSEADLRQHWQSFRRLGGITLATIYGMAKAAPPLLVKKIKSNGKDAETLPIRALSTYTAKAEAWLIHGICARGMLTLIVGDGGVGKSLFASQLAHIVAMGGRSPAGGFACAGMDIPSQGKVLLLAQEENAETTLVPRFQAQGTDTSKIILLAGEKDYFVQLDEDIPKLENTLAANPDVCMVQIDPITAYLGGTDQNSVSNVQEVLMRLVNMARAQNVAVIGLIHPNKKIDLDIVNRAMGSKAFSTVSRNVLAMVPDPNDQQFRYAIVSKTNATELGLGFITRLHREPHPCDPHQTVNWCTIEPDVEHGLNADDFLHEAARNARERHEEGGNMTIWTLDTVNDAGMAGIDTRTLRGVVAQQWLAANEERELPVSFDNMLANALSRLGRDGRVVRSLPVGGNRRGTTQRYFGQRNATLAEILN